MIIFFRNQQDIKFLYLFDTNLHNDQVRCRDENIYLILLVLKSKNKLRKQIKCFNDAEFRNNEKNYKKNI